MKRMIFVNLPVKDLNRSMAFFSGLGFKFNPQFTDENAACMVIEEDSIYAMLLVEKFFKGFTKKGIADANKVTEVLVSLSADSRAGVDRLVNDAIAGGGNEPREKQDYGWMYSRAFEDPDGHVWEIVYMDMSRLPAEMKAKG